MTKSFHDQWIKPFLPGWKRGFVAVIVGGKARDMKFPVELDSWQINHLRKLNNQHILNLQIARKLKMRPSERAMTEMEIKQAEDLQRLLTPNDKNVKS